MSSHPVPEMLELYVDRQLTATERYRIDVHLAGCELCSNHLDALDMIVHGLDSLDDAELPAAFAAELAEEAAPSRDVLVPAARRGVLLSIALCCVSLLGICAAMLAFDSPVAGVSNDVPGAIDLLLGSPFQVQAGVFAALAVTAMLGLGSIARVLAHTPIPRLGERT